MHTFLKIFLALALLPGTVLSHDLLTPLQQYAAQHPERPETAGHTSFFSRLVHWFNAPQQLSFTYDLYGYLLRDVNEKRSSLKNAQAHYVRIPENSRVIVWADLNGAFHTLIRDLTHLQQQGIVTTHLDIASNTYFVFNGNSLEHSPYALETLTVICMLMRKNPETVFYIPGPSESKAYWRTEKLVKEMEHRHSTKYAQGFEQELTAFFDALPHALFVALDTRPHELMRISHSTDTHKLVDEQNLGNLFEPTEQKIKGAHAHSGKTTVEDIDVKILIQTQQTKITTRAPQKVRLDNQVYGATSWKIFDTFIVLDMHKQLNDSTLTANNQTYRTVTGAPRGTPAFTQPIKDELWISSTTPVLAERTTRDKNTQDALAIAINEKNKTGGINGTLLRALTIRSDYSSYEKQRELLEFFRKNSLDSILLPVSPISLEHVTSSADLPLYFYFPTADVTGNKTQNSINIKASTADETRVLIKALLDNYNLRSFALFYQNDTFGQEALQEAHKELKKRGITAITNISYHESDITFYAQAQAIIDANPDAIGFFSTPHATRALINEIGLYSLATKKLFALSPLSEAPFKYFLQKIGLSMLFGAHVPNPDTSMLEIVQEYRAVMDRNDALCTVASLEAYVAASLFLHALEQVKAPYANEKVMAYLTGLHNFNFKGIKFSFDAHKRTLAQNVWIETGKNVEWRKYSLE